MSLLPKPRLALIPILFYSILFTSCTSSSPNDETDITFDIKIQILGEGTVTPNLGIFEAQTNIKLQAMPASGFYFDRWEGFEQVEEKEEVDLILTQDLILKAIFLPLPKLSEEVLVFNIKKIHPNPIFMIENGGTTAYLTDKSGIRLQT